MFKAIDGITEDLNDLKPAVIRKKFWLKELLGLLSELIFFSAFIFFILNFQSYEKIIKYKLNPQSFSANYGVSEELKLQDQAVRVAPDKPAEKIAKLFKLEDNHIYIEKIGVNAPIIWDANEGEIMDKLQEGIAHVAGTGKPGDNLNSVITGHSSNYWWKKGDYNSVFALLPSIEKGEKIVVVAHGKINKYEVTEKKEVSKKKLQDYISQKDNNLVLMTCIPVGTNLKRLLVFAKPVI